MKPPDRDLSILRHIISYCEQIEQTTAHFGNTYESFSGSRIYRNAAALCILQIGELVGKLSEAFRAQNPAIPWRQIKALRRKCSSGSSVWSEICAESLKVLQTQGFGFV